MSCCVRFSQSKTAHGGAKGILPGGRRSPSDSRDSLLHTPRKQYRRSPYPKRRSPSPTSPAHSPMDFLRSAQYAPDSPTYSPSSPQYVPSSPSPTCAPSSPEYDPASPTATSSRGPSPLSPQYEPPSSPSVNMLWSPPKRTDKWWVASRGGTKTTYYPEEDEVWSQVRSPARTFSPNAMWISTPPYGYKSPPAKRHRSPCFESED